MNRTHYRSHAPALRTLTAWHQKGGHEVLQALVHRRLVWVVANHWKMQLLPGCYLKQLWQVATMPRAKLPAAMTVREKLPHRALKVTAMVVVVVGPLHRLVRSRLSGEDYYRKSMAQWLQGCYLKPCRA